MLDESTIAFKPTGGINGATLSGIDLSVVLTVLYTGAPSPALLVALSAITYSLSGSSDKQKRPLKADVLQLKYIAELETHSSNTGNHKAKKKREAKQQKKAIKKM